MTDEAARRATFARLNGHFRSLITILLVEEY